MTISALQNHQNNCYKDRAAALETRLRRVEAELTESISAKRLLEHEATHAKSQVAALERSVANYQSEVQRLKAHHREHLDEKHQDIARLQESMQRQTEELRHTCDAARKEALRKTEALTMLEKRYRDQTTALEQLMDDSTKRQENVSRIQATNTELTTHLDKTKKEAASYHHKLQRLEPDLKQARQRCAEMEGELEAALAREHRLKEIANNEGDAARSVVQEAVRDAGLCTAQRASLTQQVKALKSQVNQLKDCLMDEKAAREQLKARAQRKLTAAGHEADGLRERLEAAQRDLRTAESNMEQLKSLCDNDGTGRDATINQLRQQLNAAKRAAEHEKRRLSQEMQEMEVEWQEQKEREVREAVTKHERRIQDLELQLAQCKGPYNVSGSACVGSGPPGNYITTVLDYIPRAEHVRLLEARSAANEMEAEAKLASFTAKMDREWASKMEALRADLTVNENKMLRLEAELDAAKHTAVAAGKERDQVQRLAAEEVAALKQLCESLRERLETAQSEATKWQQEFHALDAMLSTQRELHERHTSQLDTQLQQQHQDANHRIDTLTAAIETIKLAKTEIEKTVNTTTARNAELESALKDVTNTRDRLTIDINNITKRYAGAENALSEANQVKLELEKGNAQLQGQVAELHRRHTDATAKCTQLEHTIQGLEHGSTELKNANKELEKCRLEVERLNARLVKAVKALEKSVEDSRQHAQRLEVVKQEQTKRADTLQTQVHHLENTILKLKEETEMTTNTIHSQHQAAVQAIHTESDTLVDTVLHHLEACFPQHGQPPMTPLALNNNNTSSFLGGIGQGVGHQYSFYTNTNRTSTTTPTLLTHIANNHTITAAAAHQQQHQQQQSAARRRSVTLTNWQQRLNTLITRIKEVMNTVSVKSSELERVKEEAAVLAHTCEDAQLVAARAEEQYHHLQTLYNELEATRSTVAAHHTQLQNRYQQLEQQYTSDLSALETTARNQLQNVHSRAEETISNLRRTSLHLQERLTGQTSRADSLAAEIEALQSKIAEQNRQAEAVEARERELNALMQQVSVNLGLKPATSFDAPAVVAPASHQGMPTTTVNSKESIAAGGVTGERERW